MKPMPSTHLMTLVTFLSLIPLVYWIPPLLHEHFDMSQLMEVIVAVGIMVPIISYIIAPITIKFHHKIYSKYK